MFPSAAIPKFEAARIIIRNQDVRSLQAGFLQSCQAFADQSPADATSPAGRVHREMINISAPAIVTAQDSSDDDPAVFGDSTQPRVALQKTLDCFSIVTFSNVQAFDPVPKFDRRIVIVDPKLAGLNLHRRRFYHGCD